MFLVNDKEGAVNDKKSVSVFYFLFFFAFFFCPGHGVVTGFGNCYKGENCLRNMI